MTKEDFVNLPNDDPRVAFMSACPELQRISIFVTSPQDARDIQKLFPGSTVDISAGFSAVRIARGEAPDGAFEELLEEQSR